MRTINLSGVTSVRYGPLVLVTSLSGYIRLAKLDDGSKEHQR
jgi:hypothetical protein